MRAGVPALRWGRRHGDVLVAWEPVNRRLVARLEGTRRTVPTRSFSVFPRPGVTVVVHRVDRAAVDNDIGQLIADELVRAGRLPGPSAFERCFAGVVESTGPSPTTAWKRFYVNTLRGLEGIEADRSPDGPVATFRQIYEHAAQLVRGRSVLDAGSCFAFFPMLLVGRGELAVTASDAHPGTVALARRMAADLDLPVDFRVADVLRALPFAPASFDTVTALHLLEHLPAASSGAALTGLCRAARRRVVVAVPLEEEPDAVYGHRQAFDLERLAALANGVPGWRGEAHEHLGGWLVLEPDGAGGRRSGVHAARRP